MEQIMLWVTIFGIIIIPLLGWVFNSLITKKIDEIISQQKSDRDLFFKKHDILKDQTEERFEKVKKDNEQEYVSQKLYDQAMAFHQKEFDGKFNMLMDSINKLDTDVKARFDDVKNLINAKFNGKGKEI